MSTVITKDDALWAASENVSALLHKNGWSVRELARRSENDPMTISRLLRRIHMPSVDSMSRIAEALGTTIDKLLKSTV